MSIDRFLRLVQILSNNIWVRHYLSSFPGQLVLEVANLQQQDLSGLRAELAHLGFQELPAVSCGATPLYRFAISRTDSAPR